MSGKTTINHDGFVESVNEHRATIKIDSMSACASCHAKGACSAADQKEKVLSVSTYGQDVKPGDAVRVMISRHTGLKAVAYGYIYPFLLLMLALITATVAGASELLAGIWALAVLPPYYLGIYLLRNRIGQKFTFTMQKI